jgi:hypothetical protein
MPKAVLNIDGPDLRPPSRRGPWSAARNGVGGPQTSEAPRPIIHLREEFRHRRPVVQAAVAGFAAA